LRFNVTHPLIIALATNHSRGLIKSYSFPLNQFSGWTLALNCILFSLSKQSPYPIAPKVLSRELSVLLAEDAGISHPVILSPFLRQINNRQNFVAAVLF
jgi:hypothetical protein